MRGDGHGHAVDVGYRRLVSRDVKRIYADTDVAIFRRYWPQDPVTKLLVAFKEESILSAFVDLSLTGQKYSVRKKT